jgi:hypothetical protein
MQIDLDKTKLIKTRILTYSAEPRLGVMTLETNEGRKRITIDADSANDLLDEVLAFFGVPRPPPDHPDHM